MIRSSRSNTHQNVLQPCRPVLVGEDTERRSKRRNESKWSKLWSMIKFPNLTYWRETQASHPWWPPRSRPGGCSRGGSRRCSWSSRASFKSMLSARKSKHRKNCECCHHHSLFKGHNVIVHIVVLNCQKCNQCLKCHVSGHKNFQKLWKLPKNLKTFRKSENIQKLSKIVKKNVKIVKIVKNCQHCQKLSNLSKNVKIVKKYQKLSTLSKIVNMLSQVMFPHHCDQMSQRSLVSRVAL